MSKFSILNELLLLITQPLNAFVLLVTFFLLVYNLRQFFLFDAFAFFTNFFGMYNLVTSDNIFLV